MPEPLASFDRGPFEEVRISLVQLRGRTYMELRVYRKAMGGVGEPAPSPEALLIPVEMLDRFQRAIQMASDGLRRTAQAAAAPAPPIVQMVDGDTEVMDAPQGAPPPVAPHKPMYIGTKAHGRMDRRIPFDCPVEYVVRDRQGEAGERRHGRTQDINPIGAQIVLPERIPVLTHIVLILRLPETSLTLLCEVVWAQFVRGADLERRGCCHGVRFLDVGTAEARILQRLLRGHPPGAGRTHG